MQPHHYSFGFELPDDGSLTTPHGIPLLQAPTHLPSALTSSSLGDSDQSSTGDAPNMVAGSPAPIPPHGGISAIEVARLRAQEHAQKFKGKRVGLEHSRSPCVQTSGVAKRRRPSSGKSEPVHVSTAAAIMDGTHARFDNLNHSPDMSHPEFSVAENVQVGGDESAASPTRDDSDTKDDRYKRRLALNRESAAVSRVRRRAYIKELEERLACVEAEKHQLVGKLDCMFSQNQNMSKQLSDMFHLVASLHGQPNQQPL